LNEQIISLSIEEEVNPRLDHFLVNSIPDLSRSRLQKIIKAGLVTVNGEVILKPGFRLVCNDDIQIKIPATKKSILVPEDIPLNIIFEDEDVIIIDKQAGIVVHPSAGHDHGTLVNAIISYLPDIKGVGGEQRPGVVHRLDKDTSGLIVFAKNDKAHHHLQDQFRLRHVEKYYTALVNGFPPTAQGRIEASIGRDRFSRKKMAVVPDHKGRIAVSEYRLLEKFSAHSLLEIRIYTGRTHQIRVHMAFLGCPVEGDAVYGRTRNMQFADRHYLHSHQLRLTLPGDNEKSEFVSPLPLEFKEILRALK
jgi:23S rRNA pseudouridine1911/1915/1917 synthase